MRAGLAHNPFVAERAPGVADAVWLDRGLPALPAAGVVEVVGVRGAGKTALLLRWMRERDGTYHHVDPGRGRVRPLPVRRVVAWDEADRVPPVLLRHAVRRVRARGGLAVLGTHRPLGHGDVVHHLPAPTAEEVRRWAALRIAAASPDGTPALHVPADVAAAAAAASGGSWWQVGCELHAWAAREVEEVAGADRQRG